MQLFGCLQHLETGAAAHLEVADNDIEKALVEFLDGGIAVWRFFDLVSGLGDRLPESTAQRIVIVSNENAAHTVAPRLLQCVAADRYRQRDANQRAAPRGGAQVDLPIVGV